MKIKLIQLDGELPNMAIMKFAHYFKAQGANVDFSRSVRRDMYEPKYDFVFASQIFSPTKKKADLLRDYYPQAVIGGTGTGDLETTVENYLGIPDDYKFLDYSFYPDFQYSIGMTHLGCTNNCSFCCVPQKEGVNRPLAKIAEIYRGSSFERNLILLDNDFQSRLGWQEVCEEIVDGDFKVAFVQGINIRKMTDEHGKYFKQMKFRDRNFKKKRFYCAWDFAPDYKAIKRGIDILEKAGICRSTVTPYFLCNYPKKGLNDSVWKRFLSMAEWGLRPYCMIYEKWTLPPNDDLKIFQNWVNTYHCYAKPTKEGFAEYREFYLNGGRKKEVVETKQSELLGF